MKTPLPVLEELAKYPELADVPAGLLRETADVLSSYASVLRHEVIYREARGGSKTFKGPDFKKSPPKKEKRR